MQMKFTLEYWEDGDWFVGRLREIPGVFTQGKTLGELEENIRDAYQLMVEDIDEPPADTITKELAVSI